MLFWSISKAAGNDVIGIDLSTTNSCVAVIEGKNEVLSLFRSLLRTAGNCIFTVCPKIEEREGDQKQVNSHGTVMDPLPQSRRPSKAERNEVPMTVYWGFAWARCYVMLSRDDLF
ncbi:hypothetical protein MRB53_013867 [Persea americana]|uniref:Uncharacterized protein n=1 Tax=Persea americana TaxID=3435 RepID=A0ACC2K9D8_PERAE|nr:hypothetical protein MRB53_013867 [Persea americana]